MDEQSTWMNAKQLRYFLVWAKHWNKQKKQIKKKKQKKTTAQYE